MSGSSWHIAVVNYRTPELAVRAARSCRSAAPHGHVVVVDSASQDQSVELLARDGTAEILALEQNRGYGYALNRAMEKADAPYLLCLNADVTIAGDTLDRLERRFESLPRLGLLAPRLLSADGTPQPSCRRFPTHKAMIWSRHSPLASLAETFGNRYVLPEPAAFTFTEVVAGACVAVRRSCWEELGGMDERFFLYAEDTDLCLRARRADWLVGYDPAAAVQHVWGAATKTRGRQARRIHAESINRYFAKHYPRHRLANTALRALLRLHLSLTR